MKSIFPIISVLFVFLLASGCERSDEPDHLFERFALQDTLHLAEIVEIGDEEGTDISMPGMPAFDTKGNVYVTDAGYRDVRVFSQEGALLHTIGESGEGPGEFRAPEVVTIGAKDSVFVYDRMLRRLSAFAPLPNPTFAYSFDLKSSALRGAREVFASHGGALFVTYERGINREGMEEGVWLTEINHEGAIVKDSLAHFPTLEMIRAQRGEGHMQGVAKPFGRQPIVRPGPAGYPCYGWPEDLRIQCLNENGTSETLIDIPVSLRSVTRADRREVLERLDEVPNAATMIEEEGWHDTHPAYELFTIESPERIWIRGLYDPDETVDPFVPSLHVVDMATESIYPVGLEDPLELIFAVQDERVLAYRMNTDTGENRLVVYQIET